MTTLRVLIDRAAIDHGLRCRWALVPPRGGEVRTGTGTPEAWPRASRVEGLLAPDLVRIQTLALPPVPPQRLRDAARFALEDQTLEGPDRIEIAVTGQQSDGSVRVAIASSEVLAQVRDRARRQGVSWDLLCPASEWVRPAANEWLWIATGDSGRGFVVTADRTVFEVDADDHRSPPAALSVALAEARRQGRAPSTIGVMESAEPVPDELAVRMAEGLGVAVEKRDRWNWAETPAITGDVLDLTGTSPTNGARRGTGPSLFRRAGWVLALVAGFHLAATVADWAWSSWRLRSVMGAQRELAESTAVEFLSAQPPVAAVARKHREARHRAGLSADDDFFPLLGRASEALRQLPRGAIRSLAFSGGQITAEVGPVSEDALAALQRDLAVVGLATVAAPTAAGAKIRISLD